MATSRLLDLTDQRFGRWIVVAFSHTNASSKAHWFCRCDCGVERIVLSHLLRSGESQSCGCLHREIVTDLAKRRFTKHGHSSDLLGKQVSPEYRCWANMIQRCENHNRHDFEHYGGRGITVCERWRGPNGFSNFLADMGPRPKGMTLDRIDNDLGYFPANCRWTTWQVQNDYSRKRHP